MTGQIVNDWIRVAGDKFNWFVTPDNTWIVRPSSLPEDCQDPFNLTKEQLACLEEPSLKKRETNTIATVQTFSDFYLSLKFRCPDARDIFYVTHDDNEKLAWTRGARNWGNSGIKIFNNHNAEGTEIPILDNYFVDKSALLNSDKPEFNSGLNNCSSAENGYVPIGQLCGGLYMKVPPMVDTLEHSAGWPIPEGEWNRLDVFFRARRVDKNSQTKEEAEITVLINNEETVHQKLDYSFTRSIVPLDKNTWVESDRIYLQEHDNMVEFKDISIVPVE